MNLSRLISIGCLTLLFSSLVHAQDWYQIEVIAFEYTRPNHSDVELWNNNAGEPDWKNAISLTDEATGLARRKQEEAAKAAAAPPPAPTPPPVPEPTQAQNTEHHDHDHEDDDYYYDEEGNEIHHHAEAAPAPAPPPPPEPPKPAPREFVTVEEILTGQHDQAPAQTPPATTQPPLDFVALPNSQYTMKEIETKLHRQGNYKILTHTAWRQAAFADNHEGGVHLFGGNLLNQGAPLGQRYLFEGLISLKSGKYLELDVDAILHGKNKNDQGSKFNSPADLTLLGHEGYQIYRLEQSQRVRPNKVYYFDHPLMGVIVKISPYGG